MSESDQIIRLEKISKLYRMGTHTVRALNEVELSVAAGEFLAITGASGSGKSTLLHIIGCLDSPTSGGYFLEGNDVSILSDTQLSALRARKIGFVFQSYNLIPQLRVIDNILLPLKYSGTAPGDGIKRGMKAIDEVGLTDRIDHRPGQLSGGEMQRVAIARALINDPLIILADEPTGNLDRRNTDEIMAILKRLHQDGRTIVVATHDQRVAACAAVTVHLEDGSIIEQNLQSYSAGG